MNYELAKQLKNAGFKQIRHYDVKDYLPEPLEDGSYNKNDLISVPTLAELIVACGDKFNNLHFFHYERKNLDNKWICNFNDEFNSDGDSEGTTPEEAVARLWLKLNK